METSKQRLEVAWNEVNHSLQINTARTSLVARHRLTACCLDVLNFMSVFQDAHDKEIVRSRDSMMIARNFSIDDFSNYWKSSREETMESAGRLATSFKAMYFFVRALQDAAYCVLLELLQSPPKMGGSMSSIKNETNPVRQLIDSRLPGYRDWFKEHRDMRNKLKSGRTTGSGYTESPELPEGKVFLSVQRTQENPPLVAIEKDLSIDDVDESLRRSVELLKLITDLTSPAKKAS